MSRATYAGQRDDGLYAYVVTTRWASRETSELVWETDLLAAKAAHGFTRELHTTKRVRRAKVADVEDLSCG